MATRTGMDAAPRPDPRSTRIAAKQARLRAIAKNMTPPRVRVVPASDELRSVLRHPHAIAFRSSGSVEWPLDRFTHRRLADGSITIAENHQQKESQHQQHRHQSTPAAEPARS